MNFSHPAFWASALYTGILCFIIVIFGFIPLKERVKLLESYHAQEADSQIQTQIRAMYGDPLEIHDEGETVRWEYADRWFRFRKSTGGMCGWKVPEKEGD